MSVVIFHYSCIKQLRAKAVGTGVWEVTLIEYLMEQ